MTTGTITSVGTTEVGGVVSLSCTLFDGSCEVELLFIGRQSVAGLEVGARCKIEGTARMGSDRLVVWNPLYQLESSGRADWPTAGEQRND